MKFTVTITVWENDINKTDNIEVEADFLELDNGALVLLKEDVEHPIATFAANYWTRCVPSNS
jgi:hypothetical protein